MEPTNLTNSLNKEEVDSHFNKIFEDQSNLFCYECNKKGRQWADKSHAIFLCLNCAALYKEIKIVAIKSIGLDLWSQYQLLLLQKGGNKRFKDYLAPYDLQLYGYKDRLKTKAASYYRKLLIAEMEGNEIQPAPTLEDGKQIQKINQSLTDMSPDEILEEAKEKAVWIGHKTKQLGGKAYDKVHDKITSGELKEDAKKAAEKISQGAKDFWGFMKGKIEEMSSKEDKK